MPPLHINIYDSEAGWGLVGKVGPDDPQGSVSNNKPDGSREVYLFDCAFDDSKSTIYRSPAGIDWEVGPTRAVASTGRLEIVKELKPGESYELLVKTDKSPEPRRLRFTHKQKLA